MNGDLQVEADIAHLLWRLPVNACVFTITLWAGSRRFRYTRARVLDSELPAMAVADALITQLSGAERQVLDAWTAKFEESWHADRLAQVLQTPPPDLVPYPRIYITEFVKIDFRKQWESGQLRRVEGYIAAYPQLGNAETVSVELLYAEFLACRMLGRAGAFEDLAARFPRQANKLREMIGRKDAELPSPTQLTPRPFAALPPVSAVESPASTKQDDGLKFGRFRVEKQIDSDLTGETYLARDSIYDRRVHVKTVRFSGRDAAKRTERYLDTARGVAKLQHENIGDVYAAGHRDGLPYVVTAMLSGRPLTSFVDPEHPFTEWKAAGIVRQLALALHDAHSIGVIHGDIKPVNIVIDRNRCPQLINFGLAERISTGDDREIYGTAAYVAPEQLAAHPGDGPAGDQYSLGIVLFEMLTGRLPVEGNDAAILSKKQAEEIPPPSSLRPNLDPRIDDLAARMTSRYVEDRFADMRAVANAMQQMGASPAPHG